MTEEELITLVDTEFERAMGAPGGEISTERADAWDYYLSKPLGNEIDGQSEVVTSDVADAVDGIMPSLLRIFTVSENLIDFDPVGSEDIPRAQQESDYVNHIFFKKNPAFLILYIWFFDALVQKNGIVKAWWDESEQITTESYQGLTDDELAELMADDELEAIEQEERELELAPGMAAAAGFADEAAQALERQIAAMLEGSEEQQTVKITVHDVKFQRKTKSGRITIEPVPPEQYRISPDAHSLDPSRARMVGQEPDDVTRSDLIDMGFDKDLVMSLPATTNAHDSEEEQSRYNKTDEDDEAVSDPLQEKIEIKEAYIRVDYDGDGRAELRQVITAGNKVLSNEEVDRQPFHVLSPQPLPHKHFGRATAEKIMDVQKVTTTLTRQILDNLYLTNNPEQNVWEQAIGDNTLDDLLTRRAGKVNRFERPVSEAYSTNVVPFTAAASFPMLELWEKVKRDRTGISSDSDGLDPEALKNIQTTVLAQANDLSRLKVEAVARIFAETGIKSLFLHIHELLLKHQKREDVVRLRGEFVTVDPREWRSRSDMTVRIGLGIGSKEQNLVHLNAIWEKQKQIVESGGLGVLVSPQNLYNTASEFVKNANLKSPDLFFTDPGNQQIQQPQDGQGELLRAQIELQQSQQQIEREKNEIRRQSDMLQHQRELERLRQGQEKIDNDVMVKLEEIANELTKLDLEHVGVDVPGSRTEGDRQ